MGAFTKKRSAVRTGTERFVDLHAHTTCSDGLLTPVELVNLARKANLAALAITDHDTVDAIAPAIAASEDLEIIAGVELSACEGNADIHLLGYFVDSENSELAESLQVFRSYRYQRAQVMVEKLHALGIRLAFDDVLSCAGGATASVGRPHVAQALVENGYVATMDEAFRSYLGSRGPAYAPKSKLSVPDAIRLVHAAGGVAVLAHPHSLNRDELIPSFVEAGLDGLEGIYPDHTDAVQRHYRQIAAKHEIVITGGTDYHGGKIGRPDLGSLRIPYSYLEILKSRRSSQPS